MIDIQIKNKVSFRFICIFRNISSDKRILTIIHDTLPFKYDKISLSCIDDDKDINRIDDNKDENIDDDKDNNKIISNIDDNKDNKIVCNKDDNNIYDNKDINRIDNNKDNNIIYVSNIDDYENYLIKFSYNNILIIYSDVISGHNIKYSDNIEISLYYYEERLNKEYKDEYEIPEAASTSNGLTETFKRCIIFLIILLSVSLIGLCVIKSCNINL